MPYFWFKISIVFLKLCFLLIVIHNTYTSSSLFNKRYVPTKADEIGQRRSQKEIQRVLADLQPGRLVLLVSIHRRPIGHPVRGSHIPRETDVQQRLPDNPSKNILQNQNIPPEYTLRNRWGLPGHNKIIMDSHVDFISIM